MYIQTDRQAERLADEVALITARRVTNGPKYEGFVKKRCR
jgi:hypothetical protein